jgi:predicted RecA/RadA family phage recombinase
MAVPARSTLSRFFSNVSLIFVRASSQATSSVVSGGIVVVVGMMLAVVLGAAPAGESAA